MNRVEQWRHLVEIVAFCLAGVWAFYVFIYQERIKPSTAPLKVQHTIAFEHTITSNGKEIVRVDVSFKNIGESIVSLDGMIVNVYGTRFGTRSGVHVERPLSGVDKRSFTLLPTQPRPLYSFVDQWYAMGAHKGGNVEIEPGQEWHELFAFAIHPGDADVANVVFYFCTSRPTRQIWNSPVSRQPDGTSMWQVPEAHDGLECGFQRSGLVYAL